MAKLCSLFVLAALAVVARGIRIDPPKLTQIGKYFAGDAEAAIKVDDPICRTGDGLYPHPSDCTQYLACRDGVSQTRTCPEGFKFDSRRHCTPDVDVDCGKPQAIRVKSSDAELTCPEPYGQFPYPGDCRKYIVCDNGIPTSWMCNGEQVYEQGVGCWDGGVCHDSPQQQAQGPLDVNAPTVKCPESYGIFPYPWDCHKYIVCVEYQNRGVKTCDPGLIFVKNVGCVKGVCTTRSEVSAAEVTCPNTFGYFPVPEDCHKFMICVDSVPTLHTCPEGQIYKDYVGCVEGTVCPQQQSQDSQVTCLEANALYPHEQCTSYYKCVDFRPYTRECPRETAFDPKKSKCTRAMYSKCMRKNDLQDIMRA